MRATEDRNDDLGVVRRPSQYLGLLAAAAHREGEDVNRDGERNVGDASHNTRPSPDG